MSNNLQPLRGGEFDEFAGLKRANKLLSEYEDKLPKIGKDIFKTIFDISPIGLAQKFTEDAKVLLNDLGVSTKDYQIYFRHSGDGGVHSSKESIDYPYQTKEDRRDDRHSNTISRPHFEGTGGITDVHFTEEDLKFPTERTHRFAVM